MADKAKYAIVTPYYKEERRLLERCIASVRNQSVPTDHFLIADGFPQDWIDAAGVRHFKLDRSHGVGGTTPRRIGGLLAVAEGYDGIGLLDADNWLEPGHVKECLAAASTVPNCDYVMAQRTFRRPDESAMPIRAGREDVDTNLFFMLRGAFCVVPHWAMMPRPLSPLCDIFFHGMLRHRGFALAFTR
jgi:glycosyltransferase involved in cell wall biosynthesis